MIGPFQFRTQWGIYFGIDYHILCKAFRYKGRRKNKASYAKIRRARPAGEGGSGAKIGVSQREPVNISLTITATDHHPLRLLSVKRGSGSIFFLKNAVLGLG